MKWILAVVVTSLLAGGHALTEESSPVLREADPALAAYLHRSGEDLMAAAVSLPEDAPASGGIIVDYPTEGSLFPPDIIAPTFQWRDTETSAAIWQIEVSIDGKLQLKLWSNGEKMQLGEIDTSIVGFVPPTLTPEQIAGHSWKPDAKTWEKIKKLSNEHPATVTFAGFRADNKNQPVSRGQVTITTSKDPVGAPIFYRDVPLLPPPLEDNERGVIRPLPESALPKIQWRLKSVSEPGSKLIMAGLPTCANCHSISRDGKTLGIDVDGPQNDKGLYGLIPIKKVSTISNEYVIHWAAFTEKGSQKRFGFMSQISPDGKFVVTSVAPPNSHGPRMVDRLYNGFYKNYGFGQVFFPTKGLLAWYSKEQGKLAVLPGADDPEYVQTSAFWSPDGKYLVFSRAKAQEPYHAGQTKSEYANDPNETQVQYDLYKIPFNDGKGGKAEPLLGASGNGLSNNFPKVSPDGKWIVFVQNKNGLLMRPDSHLYIVPAEGGTARRLDCNQQVMNSWHSWSPNGRWLVFSSKSPSLYTHMYLTHIDENGNDSPAIMIDNATAANRAVNIPEFMNVPYGGLDRIDAPATEFYHLFDLAVQLADKKQYDAAVPAWKKAIDLAPDDPRAHNNLGVALVESGKSQEGIAEYRKSLELNADSAQTENNLGSALAEQGNAEQGNAEQGNMDEALRHFERAIELDPDNGAAHVNLGNALWAGGHKEEALQQLQKGVELEPKYAEGQNSYGVALAKAGRLDEALTHLEIAVEEVPRSAAYHANYGRVLAAKGDFPKALAQYEEAVKLASRLDPSVLDMLAAMYSENGRYQDAVTTARKALELAGQQGDADLSQKLKMRLERYEAMAAGPQQPSVVRQP